MWKFVSTVMLVFLMAGVAACQSAGPTPPPQAIISTPVGDLPISSSRIIEQQLPTPVPDSVIAEADAEHLLLTNIYERTAPSVVNIEVVSLASQFSVDLGRGSGFVYDLNGHIITNAHVVNNAQQISVTFNDGFIADAEIIGTDIYSDLAVIKVDVPVSRLFPLELSDSDGVQVGQRAIAIGNPFGLNSSMTVGIVSALGRQLSSAELIDSSVMPGFQNPQIIQVDTNINPGNSGGPLLDSRGMVIGVNTAIRTESGIFEGVGFSVPSNTVNRVIPELISSGTVDYSWIGITSFSTDNLSLSAIASELDLPVNAGVLVASVMDDSPAAKAGLIGGDAMRRVRDRPVCVGGDIIIAVDDNYIRTMDELVAYLVIRTMPGDTVNLLVVRGGETFELPVTLESRPSSGRTPECGE